MLSIKLSDRDRVAEESVASDVHRLVILFKGRRISNVRAFDWITNFLHDVVYWINISRSALERLVSKHVTDPSESQAFLHPCSSTLPSSAS